MISTTTSKTSTITPIATTTISRKCHGRLKWDNETYVIQWYMGAFWNARLVGVGWECVGLDIVEELGGVWCYRWCIWVWYSWRGGADSEIAFHGFDCRIPRIDPPLTDQNLLCPLPPISECEIAHAFSLSAVKSFQFRDDARWCANDKSASDHLSFDIRQQEYDEYGTNMVWGYSEVEMYIITN